MRQFGFLIVLVMISAFAQAADTAAYTGGSTGGMNYSCDANTNRCECKGVWDGADCKFMRKQNCPNADKDCESILEICRCTAVRTSNTIPKPLALPGPQQVSPLATPTRTPTPVGVPIPYPNTSKTKKGTAPKLKSTIIAPSNIVAPARAATSKSRLGTASIIQGGDAMRCCDGPGDIIACKPCIPGTKVKILANPGVAKPQAASGLPTGKRQHLPVNVTKPVDK